MALAPACLLLPVRAVVSPHSSALSSASVCSAAGAYPHFSLFFLHPAPSDRSSCSVSASVLEAQNYRDHKQSHHSQFSRQLVEGAPFDDLGEEEGHLGHPHRELNGRARSAPRVGRGDGIGKTERHAFRNKVLNLEKAAQFLVGETKFKVYTARDVALGLIDVVGWIVVADGKGEVGKVAEIIHIGRSGASEDGINTPYEYLLKVVRPCSSGEKSGEGGGLAIDSSKFYDQFTPSEIKILIPIVEEFMQHIDPVKKCLLVKPPDGLLELAARPEAIAKLRPEIQLFCKRYANFLEERFIGKMKLHSTDGASCREIMHSYMPTRDQMFAVGRADLVRRIKDAGGFLYVANVLGLKSTRRPNGFWDDLWRLDFEIECFLLESWVKHVHKETGEVYFKNAVSNEVTLEKPVPSGKPAHVLKDKSSLVDRDVRSGSKVMPRMRLLAKAGRWDLHHAIVWNGGYREVANLLERRMIRSSIKFSQ